MGGVFPSGDPFIAAAPADLTAEAGNLALPESAASSVHHSRRHLLASTQSIVAVSNVTSRQDLTP